MTSNVLEQETYKPTAAMAKVAKRILAIRRELPPSKRGMTSVGLKRANQIANRQNLSLSTVKRMKSFFDRHEKSKSEDEPSASNPPGKEPSKWRQAWDGWGGNTGRRWANSIVKKNSEDSMSDPQIDFLEFLGTDEAREAIAEALAAVQGEVVQENQVPSYNNVDLTAISDPTPQEMDAINKLRPSGTEAYKKEEFKVLTIIAANNLANRSGMAWTIPTLESMAKNYVGADVTVDHEWGKVKEVFGFVFDAMITKTPNPDQQILAKANRLDDNLDIVRRDGVMARLVLKAAIPTKNDVELSKLRYREMSDVSVGGQFFGEMVCPECLVPFGTEDPDNEGEFLCNHYPPSDWGYWYLSKSELKRVKTYALREGATDMVEISFVLAGKAPDAGLPANG